MALPFAKLHGAGNGYLVIDGRTVERDWLALAQAMTQHHTGVGSDGLIVVQNSSCAQVRMRVINSDGSEAEMSGNGIRLLAKFVLDRGIVAPGPDGLMVETGSGIRTVWPTWEQGKMAAGRVAMGTPVMTADDIPVRAPDIPPHGEVRSYPFEAEGRTLHLTCLAIGNPHAVAFLDEPVDTFPLAEVGPVVQYHPMFPNRINFEIVYIRDRDNIQARVFERSEGETLSSGTCSTAAAIAAHLHGHTADQVRVHLPGGVLEISWPGQSEAYLDGPVEEVFTGIWPE
ncbi:MAG: hypothetical protein ETSY1_18415 [Candidatus Entotheonella factor]|uniref:Diaminopimelate epimerase n=1 Tax=Entotheonella factor TaxID=1429438 RepID=W4LLD1_ENTF1|nr:diaminopimelate epimerase [Candidatus Entotheonella palauensis]ETW98525.1 MAG: hypothetical protein ETSY1_18415 [Candidatus Entotheonella factor]